MTALRRDCVWTATVTTALTIACVCPRRTVADPPPQGTASRPMVIAVLREGERVEGVLERFDDGVYWVLVGKGRKMFAERDISSITFRSATSSLPPDVENAALTQLIQEFFSSPAGEKASAHPSLIPKLAAAGPRVIRPLLAAFQKHDDDYQAVGQVLNQMGPEVFPVLIECVREDPGRSARFPVWWALRESGVKHAPFVQGMLKDKDPRIRLLGMDVLYSWSITSGVALPKTLDLPLIQILDDPEDDVRRPAPLILGRIGFNSELVFPTLLRTLDDENYASVRSNSVIALGHLGRDLKTGDPDLARMVVALARTVTSDMSQNVRCRCAYYLGELGPKAMAAVPALRKATDDKKELVRRKAEEALRKIGPQP